MPNSANKMNALKLANKIEEASNNAEKAKYGRLFSNLIAKPSMEPVRRALEGNDFSGNMANIPANMRPTANNMAKKGGKRSLRKKRTLRKKRAARKTRRHQ
jgi:hypothetical protein